jgi:hypothetical protein
VFYAVVDDVVGDDPRGPVQRVADNFDPHVAQPVGGHDAIHVVVAVGRERVGGVVKIARRGRGVFGEAVDAEDGPALGVVMGAGDRMDRRRAVVALGFGSRLDFQSAEIVGVIGTVSGGVDGVIDLAEWIKGG